MVVTLPKAIDHSELPFASVSKPVFVQSHSYKSVFHLQVQFYANQTSFHGKGFARGLVLKQRHNVSEMVYCINLRWLKIIPALSIANTQVDQCYHNLSDDHMIMVSQKRPIVSKQVIVIISI